MAGKWGTTEAGSLPAMLREGTSTLHRAAERTPFQRVFFRAELPREAYSEWMSRLWFIYDALETAAEQLRDHPIVGAMYSPQLHRREGLEHDLTFYVGSDWRGRIAPSPVTTAYVERINWARDEWPPGVVAHQWLRYLGSLGGQEVLRGLVNRAYGVTGEGWAFYEFPQIDDVGAFFRDYHARMDALPLTEDDKLRMVDEGNRAFQLNIDLTDELAADFAIEAPPGPESAEIEQLEAQAGKTHAS